MHPAHGMSPLDLQVVWVRLDLGHNKTQHIVFLINTGSILLPLIKLPVMWIRFRGQQTINY